MHIDCDRCEMRGLACSDCFVSVLLGSDGPGLGGDEEQAIGVLADAGLVPPLRLVVRDDEGAPTAAEKSGETPPGDLRRTRRAG
ncbi:hypothetical protein CLV30_1179 [Haloactinopolyspora alba]|uniref:Uncharacterized protein n=1 Tax=Haloactinopolyspora alba TaxID=648780 RepID=A0A2P8DR65_9ACTN|nr:hypothetical protein [Haloactinopolyspora alba]PSK99706.1 hypothetical protein CLV30_1179 [Haloactinopolyspora alba]